ncbi:hypothetical protein [Thioclava sp. F36-6]|uniref:hypothetical protein n=1 Tax=Thioclava sp. F36-6 TaxID=1915316 RepID=UPI0011BA8890|nr:hypothetical protein [Thioclava sp. F36-6]
MAGALLLKGSCCTNGEAIAALARGASSRNTLISAADIRALDDLSGPRFFEVQMVLCEVIPQLVASPPDVMTLVSTLVEKGGDDLAATQPNAAFRVWCAIEDHRADQVIISARRGDALALRHLVFALQAKGDVEEAFRSAGTDGEERTAGVLALSRMTLNAGEAGRAIDIILSAAKPLPPTEAAGMIKAALDIAGKHSALDRHDLIGALDGLSGSSDPVAVHLMATALYWHGDEMSDTEVASCLRGIQNVVSENAGTVRQIDDALQKLWPTRPCEVGKAVADLISTTKGRVGNKALEGILSSLSPDQGRAFAQLATNWFLGGNYHVCSSLASHLSEIDRTTPCLDVPAEVLPVEASDQLFVCRKAIGFLFLAPMTAASWIVAVFRGGGSASADAAELLFNPLLLNYGGALKDWLEKLLEEEAPGNDVIREVLRRAQEVWGGLGAVREVVELEPSTARRALVRFQQEEEAESINKEAQKKSVFLNLVTRQTLLYGDRSSFSILDGEGRRRPQTVNMASFSVSSEIPMGLSIDPVGTEWIMEVFRYEQKAKA